MIITTYDNYSFYIELIILSIFSKIIGWIISNYTIKTKRLK